MAYNKGDKVTVNRIFAEVVEEAAPSKRYGGAVERFYRVQYGNGCQATVSENYMMTRMENN